MATFVSLPFYLLTTLQRPQMTVGVLLAGWPVGAAMIAAIAGPLSDRFPVAILGGIGAAAMALGLTLIALMPATVDNTWLFFAMMLAGVGFGFFQTPNNRVLIGAAPRNRAGALGGLQSTTRVFSQTFGGAVVAMVFSMGFSIGPLLGLWVAICFALVAVSVNVIRYRQAPHSGQNG
jgi:DHA2 family multidrug resistance protein-like MFS transporter